MSSFLHLLDVTKSYGSTLVLADIDLKVRQREFCTVVGPSGCGKSTLLRLILGQETPSSGTITMNGQPIRKPEPNRGIVYQRYALFPHLTVVQNIMMGQLLIWSPWKSLLYRKAAREEALHYLENVQLAEHADKYPHELSGGMQQRVAIAQALIKKPQVLMMDEPFGALDPGTREAMQVLILHLWETHGMTIFFVTHDLEEAVFIGTRLIVLSQFYTVGPAASPRPGVGARIVGDYPLDVCKSTHAKETAEFGHIIQTVRHEGFDPHNRQHVEDFSLLHSDAFQTLKDNEYR